jgi:hypothetical protein
MIDLTGYTGAELLDKIRELPAAEIEANSGAVEKIMRSAGIDESAIMDIIPGAAESRGNIGNKRFAVKRIGNSEILPPQWIVKGLIEEDSIVILYGQSGTRKSFFAIDWACCIATGTKLHGMEIKKPGPVVYIAAEGRGGIARRLGAWSIANNTSLKDAPLYGNATPIELIAEGTREAVVSCFDQLAKELETPPVLCVLDTWSRARGVMTAPPWTAQSALIPLPQ